MKIISNLAEAFFKSANNVMDKVLEIPSVKKVFDATDNIWFDGAIIAAGVGTFIGLRQGWIPANLDPVGISMLFMSVTAPILHLAPFMNRITDSLPPPPNDGPK